jgi:hypothetical protein
MSTTSRQQSLLQQLVLAVVLITLAVGWRIVNHQTMVAPNLELVTAVSLVGAVVLQRYLAFALPVAILFLSDVLIGNSSVAWFTWSAFLLVSVAGLALRRWRHDGGKLLWGTAGMGLGAAVFFFAWTNFGVWLMGDGSYYPKTVEGLVACFAAGVPFFRNTLLSGVVLAPALMGMVYLGRQWVAAGRRQLAVG